MSFSRVLQLGIMRVGVRAAIDSVAGQAEPADIPVDFDEAFTLHHRTVFRAARSVVQDAGLAEDVTQEVFLRLYNNIDSIADMEMLRPWLIRVAINVARNTIRFAFHRERLILSHESQTPVW